MKYAVIVLLLLRAAVATTQYSNSVDAQNTEVKRIGIPFIQNYLPTDYVATNQNWDGVIDSRGMLYVANNNCILEYDGTTWKRLEVPSATAKSLAFDHNDRLFVGSSGEIGHLKGNKLGVLEYVSLKSLIPEKYQNFGDVFSTHLLDSSIVFQTPQSILIYDGDSIVGLSHSDTGDAEFLLSYKVNNRVFVSALNSKLYEVVKRNHTYQLSEVYDGSSLGVGLVFAMLPYSESEVLLFTKQGAYVYNYDTGANEKWETEANSWSIENGIFRATTLRNGLYVLGSMSGGALITNSKGKIIQILNTERGIVDNTIANLLTDEFDNLWLMTNNGLSYVEIGSPFSRIGKELGIEGQVLGFVNDDSKIYAGTSQGLYYSTKQDLNNPKLTVPFKKVLGIESQVLHIDKLEGLFIVGTIDGLRQIDTNGQVSKIGSRVVWDFVSTLDFPNKIIACNSEGHILMSNIESKKAQFVQNLGSIGNALNYIVYHGEGLFLTGNWFNGVYSFRLNEDLTEITDIKSYSTDDGLPTMNGNGIYKINGETIVSTTNGVYFFDPIQERFFPDSTLTNTIGNRTVEVIENDSEGGVYFNGDNSVVAIYDANTDTTLCSYCFNDLIDQTIFRVFSYDEGEMLFAGGSQMIHFDPKINTDYVHPKPYSTLIRTVEVMGRTDSLIFGGFNINGQDKSALTYSFGDFRFTYSAPYFKNSNKTQYSYMLEGQDEYWSAWSLITSKEYTNLAPGQYLFKVKAKNVFGHISQTTQFKFNILTPWHLTNWAYAFYVLIGFFIVWIIVKLNSVRLKRENERLESTISERTEEIRQQAEKLKTLDNAKSRFFANVSHELRTPLTLIQGPLETVLGGKEGKINPRVQDQLALSRKSTKKLLRLVEEILDLSKLEAGKLDLKPEAVKCYDLIGRIFYTYQSSYSGKHLDFQMQYDLPEQTILKLDIGKFEKVLDNLMSNAVKFTRDQGSVKMTVKHTLEQLEISVADTGVGIPPDELAQVFNRFYQSGSGKKYKGGTGIGLALAKELVQLMGGALKVESVEHEGTVFTLTIPYEEATTADIPLKVTALPEAEIIETSSEATEIDQDPLLLRNVRILVVEDDPSMRKYIASQLEAYAVDQAEDGLVAIELIEKNNYDLVITDLMMPRLDGMDLVSNLRQSDETKDTSIMMLTARAADEDIVNALTIGVNDYMVKPFNPDELTARVRNILSNRASRTEAIEQDEQVSFSDQFLNDLKAFVLDHLKSSNFNVASLADKAALSERQLNRRIKQATGLTAAAFIREIRLNEARLLLENKTYSTISEVSYATGFETPGYFTTVYTKRFGRKPGDYLSS